MRHCMRRSRKEWENIGGSGQVPQWIREGVSMPFQHNRPPPPFNQVVSLLDATTEQLAFVDAELATSNICRDRRRGNTLHTKITFRGSSSSRNSARTNGVSSNDYFKRKRLNILTISCGTQENTSSRVGISLFAPPIWTH
jgi:hypothetical protein